METRTTDIKEIKDNELYVWMNGKLIYKRWLDTGYSKVFDLMAYDKYTHNSIMDLDLKETPDLIHVTARIQIKSPEEGGRKTGFLSGYRPNHVFEYKDGKLDQTFVGDINFDDQELIMPGEEKVVTVRFLFSQKIERFLNIGRKWWLHEGSTLIGEGEILEIKPPTKD